MILTACMTLPKSPQELQNMGSTKAQFMVNKDLTTVEENLEKFLNKCYNSKNRIKLVLNHAQIGPEMGFEKSKANNQVSYSVYMGLDPKLYSLGIKINKIDESDSLKIDVVAATIMWKRIFPKLERAANGSDESCPM